MGGKIKGERLKASEHRERGRAARIQKEELEREIRARDEEIEDLRARNAAARSLIDEGLETRSWRFSHRLARVGRKLRGRGDLGTSSFSKASDALAGADRDGAPAGLKYLFVTGCARSGTTATVDLLNNDPRIALGMERFKYLGGKLHPHHFLPEYFLNPSSDETNVASPRRYRALREKLDDGTVSILGDKVRIRNNVEVVDEMIAELGDVRFIYMLRELDGVASSYNRRAANPDDINWPETADYRRAVVHWNGSLRGLRELYEAGHGDRVLVVSYELLYSGETGQVRRLLDFIGLDSSVEIAKALRKSRRRRPELRSGEDLDPEAREYLVEHREAELSEWAGSLVE